MLKDVVFERRSEQIKQISSTRGAREQKQGVSYSPDQRSRSVCKQVFQQDGGGEVWGWRKRSKL